MLLGQGPTTPSFNNSMLMKFICNIFLSLFIFLPVAHADLKFLTISDIHYGPENISKDGQDTGPEFMQITLNKMKELSQTVDFILFLGDLPVHDLFNDPHKKEYEALVFHRLYESDASRKPLFYVPGNNDSLQGNYQPFESKGISPLTYAKDWDGACAYCQGLIIDGSHMYHDGYYSSYLLPNNKEIMLIALNATEWTKIPLLKSAFFKKYTHQEEDASTQLAWLEQQLRNYQAKQLLIALHEPPGKSYRNEPFWYDEYTQQFINLLNKYHNRYGQITILTSHTHMEEFRKIDLADGTNIYAYSTPGISRNHHNYPGMKIFELNAQLQIKNFTTYYTSDLHAWNNQQYQAVKGNDVIFPHCENLNLPQCLDKLNIQQVCDNLKKGYFYGVKNPKVPEQSCPKTYLVN